jgi:hypothetical protein
MKQQNEGMVGLVLLEIRKPKKTEENRRKPNKLIKFQEKYKNIYIKQHEINSKF